MKFQQFVIVFLLLLSSSTVKAGNIIGRVEKALTMNSDIQNEIKSLVGVVKSQMAGTEEERKIFLKKIKPHTKKVGKYLKKCNKSIAKIEKLTNKIGLDGPAGLEESKKLALEAESLYAKGMETLPQPKDKEFLKPLTDSIKQFAEINALMLKQVSALGKVKEALKGK